MEAVQYSSEEQKLELVELEKPCVTEPDDVLIRVLISGISKQDLHIIYDLIPCKPDEPLILGQEFCGIVFDIGCDVKTIYKGNKVVVNPNKKCGICVNCRTGKPLYCTNTSQSIGLFKNGGWSQYIIVPESQVYKVANTLNLQQAVFVEPMSRVIHGLDLLTPIPIGRNILIAGMGMLGILWAILLHFQGHRNVTISEPNLARLEIVEKLELEFLYITPVILKQNQETGLSALYNIIIDCTSSQNAIQYHSSLLHKGGTLCIFSAEPNSKSISISPYHIMKNEITLLGVNNNPLNYPRALTILELLANKYVDFDKLCVKTYALKDFKDAIKHVKKEKVIKAVFSMGIQCICRKDECHI